jgi:DnaJ like chaperone protein
MVFVLLAFAKLGGEDFMSFWSQIAQLAARAFDPATCTQCPDRAPGSDPAFATAVTALGAKLAMADGEAASIEEDAFLKVFGPEDKARADILRLYGLAKQTALGFESYAKRLAKRYASCPSLLDDVVEGLYYIAVSDGDLTRTEDEYLNRVSELLGLDEARQRRIRSLYIRPNEDDPWYVLGVDYAADLHEVKSARTALLRAFHPDTMRAKGLPEQYEALYHERSTRINQAYARIKAQLTPTS